MSTAVPRKNYSAFYSYRVTFCFPKFYSGFRAMPFKIPSTIPSRNSLLSALTSLQSKLVLTPVFLSKTIVLNSSGLSCFHWGIEGLLGLPVFTKAITVSNISFSTRSVTPASWVEGTSSVLWKTKGISAVSYTQLMCIRDSYRILDCFLLYC